MPCESEGKCYSQIFIKKMMGGVFVFDEVNTPNYANVGILKKSTASASARRNVKRQW